MIDIVRLLRADHFTQDTLANRYTEKLQNRAADEIERLRRQHGVMQAAVDLGIAEIERLRDGALLLEIADLHIKIGDLTAANAEMREALAALNLAYMHVPFQATEQQLQAMQVASDMARAALARKS